ncbi:SMP-30/gluconolactonase/LRE family protein [Streptomyces auratus]|uniref:SMP-30/gluconolactonase/LRE family protein n=1 Tax=Streptomyces TaxID=1883 RepID=UPI003D22B9D5
MDVEGCIWAAHWGGGAPRRYTSQRDLDRVIELPLRQPPACAFGVARAQRPVHQYGARGARRPASLSGFPARAARYRPRTGAAALPQMKLPMT